MNTILIINTGSQSTKIGIFKNSAIQHKYEIQHIQEELQRLDTTEKNYNFRKAKIEEILNQSHINLNSFSAIGCIGGILKPLPGGVYLVTDSMVSDIKEGRVQADHASNLAACIGYEIASQLDIPCYIADPISTDELSDIARITGLSEIPKFSRTHALNVKARARKASEEIGVPMENLTFIVAHIGGGLTVNLVKQGKIVDIEDARQYGPMSPQAAGGVPLPDFAKLCFSKKYKEKEIVKFWYGTGGLVAHLGTASIPEIEKSIKNSDKKAKLIYDAMIYQVAKAIGALYAAAKCKIDGIILTGGASHSTFLVDSLKSYIENLAPMYIYPGEEELFTLGKLADMALNKEIMVHEYK
jgi:butyrate kinase